MRILFLGDVVGRPGRNAVTERAARSARALAASISSIVNGENAAGGFGITEAICDEILIGRRRRHHARQSLPGISARPWCSSSASRSCCARSTTRPGTPGRGAAMFELATGARVLVMNLMGRLFMDPLDCPFQALDARLAATPAAARCGRHRRRYPRRGHQREAGRSAISRRARVGGGRHAHPCPTADEHILPGGTAYHHGCRHVRRL